MHMAAATTIKPSRTAAKCEIEEQQRRQYLEIEEQQMRLQPTH
jgi:hypothetical protein